MERRSRGNCHRCPPLNPALDDSNLRNVRVTEEQDFGNIYGLAGTSTQVYRCGKVLIKLQIPRQ